MSKEAEIDPTIITERNPNIRNRIQKVLFAGLALNEDRTDSLYLTREKVILKAYDDRFYNNMPQEEKDYEYRRANTGYNEMVTKILKAQEAIEPISIDDKNIRKKTKAVKESIEGLPDISNEELALLLRRKDNTFSTLLENRRLEEKGEDPPYEPPTRYQKIWDIAILVAEPEKSNRNGVVKKKSLKEAVEIVYAKHLSTITKKYLAEKTGEKTSEANRKLIDVIDNILNPKKLDNAIDRKFHNELFAFIQKKYPDSDLNEDELYRIFDLKRKQPPPFLGFATNKVPKKVVTDAEEQLKAQLQLGKDEVVIFDPKIFRAHIHASNDIAREENRQARSLGGGDNLADESKKEEEKKEDSRLVIVENLNNQGLSVTKISNKKGYSRHLIRNILSALILVGRAIPKPSNIKKSQNQHEFTLRVEKLRKENVKKPLTREKYAEILKASKAQVGYSIRLLNLLGGIEPVNDAMIARSTLGTGYD